MGPVAGPGVETLLATIYVTAGGDVSFDGVFFYWSAPSPFGEAPPYVNVAFSTAVPEPPTGALLAAGLVGAAIIGRRKRSKNAPLGRRRNTGGN